MVLRLFLCITSVHNREFVWTETEMTKRFNSKFSTVFSYGSILIAQDFCVALLYF